MYDAVSKYFVDFCVNILVQTKMSKIIPSKNNLVLFIVLRTMQTMFDCMFPVCLTRCC